MNLRNFTLFIASLAAMSMLFQARGVADLDPLPAVNNKCCKPATPVPPADDGCVIPCLEGDVVCQGVKTGSWANGSCEVKKTKHCTSTTSNIPKPEFGCLAQECLTDDGKPGTTCIWVVIGGADTNQNVTTCSGNLCN